MNRLLVLLLIFTSLPVSAESCLKLYQKKASEIQEKDGYDTHVGGHLTINNGQLGYNPGIKVAGKIDNWARDLHDGIKWGPYSFTSSPDPRKAWLDYFRKSVKDECDLPKEKHDHLRSMLLQLMEDGSFCPGGKILDEKGKKKVYRKVLKEAVEAGKFPQYCKSKGVADDSSRVIKEVEEKSSKKSSPTHEAGAQ